MGNFSTPFLPYCWKYRNKIRYKILNNIFQTYELQDEERIVGGHNAELNEWPWIVALFNGGRQFCGASLIDDKHVLSAAHCIAQLVNMLTELCKLAFRG